MLITLRRSLRLTTLAHRGFTQQAKAPLSAFLSASEIKEKVPAEELKKIEERLQQQQNEALLHHRNRLAALQKLLTPPQKERIGKIETLVSKLNEQEAEYIRFRLLAHAEGQQL